LAGSGQLPSPSHPGTQERLLAEQTPSGQSEVNQHSTHTGYTDTDPSGAPTVVQTGRDAGQSALVEHSTHASKEHSEATGSPLGLGSGQSAAV
jgi:hypothetical protein